MHLWFLAWLFLCSALGLPVFALLSSTAGRRFVNALGRLAHYRGALLLLAVPITLPRIALTALSSAEIGWSLEAFAWYAVVLVVGFLLFSDDRFAAAARRDVGLALVVASIGSAALLAAGFTQWSTMPYGVTYVWRLSLVGITGWAWTLAVLGLGMRTEFMQRPLPALAGEAALPAYVLHFPLVMAISALVVRWPLGFEAKLLANVLLGVGASLAVSVAVLRLPLLRPLLGIRRPRPAVVQSATAA
jgi:hypothetical protein